MKRLATVGVVAVGLAFLCVLGLALGSPPSEPLPAAFVPWPGKARGDITIIPSRGNNPSPQPFTPVTIPEFKIQKLPATPGPPFAVAPAINLTNVYRFGPSNFIRLPPGLHALPPGVYKTEPYSIIVVVPGPRLDDRCLIKPPDVDSSMPIITPGLRFIPWSLPR